MFSFWTNTHKRDQWWNETNIANCTVQMNTAQEGVINFLLNDCTIMKDISCIGSFKIFVTLC